MYALFKNGKQITGKIERKTDILILALAHNAFVEDPSSFELQDGYEIREIKEREDGRA